MVNQAQTKRQILRDLRQAQKEVLEEQGRAGADSELGMEMLVSQTDAQVRMEANIDRLVDRTGDETLAHIRAGVRRKEAVRRAICSGAYRPA